MTLLSRFLALRGALEAAACSDGEFGHRGWDLTPHRHKGHPNSPDWSVARHLGKGVREKIIHDLHMGKQRLRLKQS